jgi:hypothetical protein
MALTNLFYGGNGTTPVDSGLPLVGVMYGVAQNGDLLWYQYQGNGESDRSGSTGWHTNSGNPIGYRFPAEVIGHAVGRASARSLDA